MVSNFFLALTHHITHIIISFVAFFIFNFFHFAALQIFFFTKLVLKTGSYKYKNEKY